MVINKDTAKSDCKPYIAQVREIIKVKAMVPIQLKSKPTTVSWTMTRIYDCVPCVILMDKVTSNRIRICCKFLSIFSYRALL